MNTKRIVALLIAAIMVLSLIPVMTISTSAAAEGDWITYQSANNYPDLTGDDDPDFIAPPESGYEYTSDGFTVIQPDWTDVNPWVTVSTKETVNVKDGLYLEFRVDDYSYGWNAAGDNNDHWISVSLNTGAEEADGTRTGKVCPPNTNFGGGWNALLRSQGLGGGAVHSMLTVPDDKENDVAGNFSGVHAIQNVEVPIVDDCEVYTLEVTWDGSAYVIKINDYLVADATVGSGAAITELLETLSSDGEFFVGVTMMDTVRGGSAGLTITKFGTSKDNATKPVGNDEKEAGENNIKLAPIADPSTVPANTPAILWNPETYNLRPGNNSTFAVLGDDTWRGNASHSEVNFQLDAKRDWSYKVEDFPVFGIMLRNFWVDTATLWYAAGEITSATNGFTYDFSVFDGEIYDFEGDEYIFVPIDLTDLVEGRINSMRVDMNMPTEDVREFDVCFAGMFRSEDEAYAYAESWFAVRGGEESGGDETTDPGDETGDPTDETTAPVDETTAPADETTAPVDETTAPADETTAPADETTAPADETTAAPADVTTAAPADVTTAAPNSGNETPEKGCGSVIGVSAVAVLAAAAAAVALKKKD